VNPTVTYELAVLRSDELRREADRHRLAASVRSRRTRPGFRFPGQARSRGQW
jgi:hypothetical protein